MAKKKARRKPKPQKKPNGNPSPKMEIVRIPAPAAKPWELNREEVELVKSQICKGASDLEFQMCLARARHHKLDPLKGQIWFIPRRDRAAGEKNWIAQVGIAGLRHIAARDHRKDFGTEDEPEFGPMITVTWQWNGQGVEKTLQVPEWARVSIWKKGSDRPTVATVWWEEIYSNIDYAPLVRQMPRGMLGKCASAACHRKAYPETGGLYLSEEFAAQRPDYTDTGRLIAYGDEPTADTPAIGTHEAAVAVGAAKVEELKKRVAEQKQAAPASGKVAKPATVAADPTRTEAETGVPAAKKAEPVKQLPKNAPVVEIEWTAKGDAIVRGDIAEIIEDFKENFAMAWVQDWWHVIAEDVKALTEMCVGRGYRVQELPPEKVSPPSAMSRGGIPTPGRPGSKETSGSPAGETTVGMIEQAVEKMTKGSPGGEGKKPRPSVPYLSVLIKASGKSQWYSVFKKDFFEPLLKGKGKEIEFSSEKRGEFYNLVSLKRVGTVEFEDGVPVVQNRDREAGNRTLFGG